MKVILKREGARGIKGTAQGGSNNIIAMATIFETSAQLKSELHLTAFATNDGKTAYKIHCMHNTMQISKQLQKQT